MGLDGEYDGRVIEEQPADADDFDKYKAPYQAAECLVCLPKKALGALLKDASVIDALFQLVYGKVMKRT